MNNGAAIMKFSIDLEITPEELRKVLGLPDVEGFQQELLDKVRERVEAGAEGYDPLNLMKPYLPGSMDQFQRFMMQLMNSYTGSDKSKDKKS